MFRPLLSLLSVLGVVVLLGVGCPRRGGPSPSPLAPGGVYRSDDGGFTFQQKARFRDGGDITAVTPREVLIDPFEPSRLYMAAGSFDLLRSVDAGEVWDQLDTPAAVVTSVVVHPRNPNILTIAGTAEGTPDRSKIWKTFDQGETWQEVYAEPIGSRAEDRGVLRSRRPVVTAVVTLAVDPRSPEVLYAGSSSGALIASTDGGSTWSTRRSFTQGVSGMRISPGVSGQLFLRIADGTLARSDDGGRSAKRLTIREGRTTASTVSAILAAPTGEGKNTVYAGTDRGLFVSQDAGETWSVVPLPVSETQRIQVTTLAQSVDGVLWAGSTFNLYASKDGGATWRVQQFAFQNPIRFILTDPVNSQRLYAFFLPAE